MQEERQAVTDAIAACKVAREQARARYFALLTENHSLHIRNRQAGSEILEVLRARAARGRSGAPPPPALAIGVPGRAASFRGSRRAAGAHAPRSPVTRVNAMLTVDHVSPLRTEPHREVPLESRGLQVGPALHSTTADQYSTRQVRDSTRGRKRGTILRR